ncbi:hypothetical protein WA026_022289 [Henosepilachna vigintioctopunctata]|uniref:Uncharacterized protein n=1 Tax=Henosepilachna vigintioctopunctata TaxID=420089 RepID=A0AAW1VAY0_9CUCU
MEFASSLPDLKMEEASKCSSCVGVSVGSKRSNFTFSQDARGVSAVASKSNHDRSMSSDRVTRPVKDKISSEIHASTNQIRRKSNFHR